MDPNYQELLSYIHEQKDQKGALMPVLHKAQGIFGAVPKEVQLFIAEHLGIPLANIYGVLTFYSQFKTQVNGQHTISVCLGTACYVKGSKAIAEKFMRTLDIALKETTQDKRFTIEATRCIGACGLAPIIKVNDEVYAKATLADVDEIIKKYGQEV